MYKNVQCRPLQWDDKMEYVSMQMLIRYALKQCINNYQIHSWPIIAVLMTFEAKISIILISNWGCPILHAFKINKQFVFFQITTTFSQVYTDVVVLYKPTIFQFRSFLIKLYDILKINIFTCPCWAYVENGLVRRCASRSSLLYSVFRYTLELPLQPNKI